MTPREEWRGHYERLRHESQWFAKLAKSQRAQATECRRKRDWLGALIADGRAREYRDSRDNRKEEAAKIRSHWKFR